MAMVLQFVSVLALIFLRVYGESSCAPQPNGQSATRALPLNLLFIGASGYGPRVTPDTVVGFESYGPFREDALSAATPENYQSQFANLNASVSSNDYLTMHVLRTYNPSLCAQRCNTIQGCAAFNIYIERVSWSLAVNTANQQCNKAPHIYCIPIDVGSVRCPRTGLP